MIQTEDLKLDGREWYTIYTRMDKNHPWEVAEHGQLRNGHDMGWATSKVMNLRRAGTDAYVQWSRMQDEQLAPAQGMNERIFVLEAWNTVRQAFEPATFETDAESLFATWTRGKRGGRRKLRVLEYALVGQVYGQGGE